MKGFKYKNKLWRWVYVKTVKLFTSDKKNRYPKNVTEKEKTVSDIFTNLLRDPDTKLHFDLKTHECSLESVKQSLWIFLEQENMRVINSTFGYDRAISPDLVYYLTDRFKQENNKRCILMKEEALSKVEHSLSYTLNKIKK